MATESSISAGATTGERLGEFLLRNREMILSEFLSSVEADSELKASERLTHAQLKDNLGPLLEDLGDWLRAAFNEEVKDRIAYNAAIHGLHRWLEGYDISELLHELALLRSVLIHQLIHFLEENEDIGGAAALFAATTLHRFLDETMRLSVVQFLAHQGPTGRSPQVKSD